MKPDKIIFKNEELEQITTLSDKIVSALADNYKEILKGTKDKENTVKTYIRCCEHFINYIQDDGINSLSFGKYRNVVSKLDVGASTKKLRMSSAKALLQESVKHGILPIDITANVKSFSQSKKHKKDGLKEHEIVKVLAHIDSIKKESRRIKLKVMACLFIYEGLRQFEARNIKLSEINLLDRTILIQGKGEDDQDPILLMDQTVEAIKIYLASLQTDQTYLFESTKKIGEPVTLRYIRKLWTDPKYGIFAKCGFTQSVHGMRHFFTTKTLEITGGDIGMTRRRTRHKVDATVQTYDDRRLERKDLDVIQRGFDF